MHHILNLSFTNLIRKDQIVHLPSPISPCASLSPVGHSITGATSEITCGSSALALSVDAAMYLIVVWPQIGPISEQQSSLS